MKKKLLLFVFSLVLFAACSPAAADDSGDIVIRVASIYATDVPFDVFYRARVEEFSQMDNGITVVMENISFEVDYLDALRVAFAAGEPPHVFLEYGGSRILDLIEANALVNLEPFFQQHPDWFNAFYTPMFNEAIFEGHPGIWGAPIGSYLVLLYYNRDLFNAHGLTPPANFDELFYVSERFLEAGIRPFQVGAMDIWRLGHFHTNVVLSSIGTDGMNRLANRTLSYDSPEVLETFRIMEEMMDRGFFGVDILSFDYNTEKAAFAAGDVAMRWDGTWYISEILGTPIYDSVGVAAFPYVNPQFSTVSQGGASEMWFVSSLNKSDAEIEAAIEFVRFMTNTEYFALANEAAPSIFPAAFTPTPYTPESRMLNEAITVLATRTDLGPDLQNPDPEPHMLHTVRNALQGLAMGNSAEDVAAQIVNSKQIPAN